MAIQGLAVWVPADEQFPPLWRPNGTNDHVLVIGHIRVQDL